MIDQGDRIVLTTPEFEALPEYSCSLPTGQTIGKRWKRKCRDPNGEVWMLGEYVEDPEPGMIGIRWRRIKVALIYAEA